MDLDLKESNNANAVSQAGDSVCAQNHAADHRDSLVARDETQTPCSDEVVSGEPVAVKRNVHNQSSDNNNIVPGEVHRSSSTVEECEETNRESGGELRGNTASEQTTCTKIASMQQDESQSTSTQQLVAESKANNAQQLEESQSTSTQLAESKANSAQQLGESQSTSTQVAESKANSTQDAVGTEELNGVQKLTGFLKNMVGKVIHHRPEGEAMELQPGQLVTDDQIHDLGSKFGSKLFESVMVQQLATVDELRFLEEMNLAVVAKYSKTLSTAETTSVILDESNAKGVELQQFMDEIENIQGTVEQLESVVHAMDEWTKEMGK